MIRSVRFLALMVLALLALSGVSFAAELAQPQSAFPPVGEFVVLRGDFHMHTVRSDGNRTSVERVLEAQKLGLDCIAITDHGNTRGYLSARRKAEELGIVLVRGHETGLAGKEHLVVLGVSQSYRPRDSHRWAEAPGQKQAYYQEEMRRIAEAGGILFQAHPRNELREPILWGIQQGFIRGVEVKNGGVSKDWGVAPTQNTHCYAFAFDWALQHDLAIFANSDAHGAKSASHPNMTLVFAKERTEQGVLEALRAGRTLAWFDNMVWGREDLLTMLIKAMVKVRSTDGTVALRNEGPIPLKATVEGKTVEIGPYQEASVTRSGSGKLSIRWENLWKSPREVLITD